MAWLSSAISPKPRLALVNADEAPRKLGTIDGHCQPLTRSMRLSALSTVAEDDAQSIVLEPLDSDTMTEHHNVQKGQRENLLSGRRIASVQETGPKARAWRQVRAVESDRS